MVKPDEYGAGDLIHMRDTGDYLRGKDRQRGIVAAVRQHLKKANYHNFQDLRAAFQHYDKVRSLNLTADHKSWDWFAQLSLDQHNLEYDTNVFQGLPKLYDYNHGFHLLNKVSNTLTYFD